LKQFIINNDPDKNNFISFTGKDYHYLVNVRRLAAGEYFPALLPNGEETLVQIVSIEKNILSGKCHKNASQSSNNIPDLLSAPVRHNGNDSGNIPPIILFQALPKGDKMDLIVRQAAEGGISEIIPFVSEFSHGKANVGKEKFSRWQRIVKEARQQSGSKIATSLQPPLTMNELIEYWNKVKFAASPDNALGLLFHHVPYQPDIKNHAEGLEQKSLHGYLSSNRQIVVFVIGPEGGFSDNEVSLFIKNGFNPLTIGGAVLRTETAALYCAAAIRILLLEKDAWEPKII